MDDDDDVLILFRISEFGWQPYVMKWKTWQEIYDHYEGEEKCELCDNTGQTIEVDLCESVKNAIVVKETAKTDTWIEMADSYEFFTQVCLNGIPEAWVVHIELSCSVAQNLARREAEIEYCKVIGLGTSILVAKLKDHNIMFTYSSLDEVRRVLTIDGVENVLDGDDPVSHMNELLDVLQPMTKSIKQVNLRPVFADQEKEVDIDGFDNFLPEDSKE